MRKLSNRWKEKVKNGMDVQYLKYADITLTDGTVLNLTSANLWANGFSFEDSVSGDSSFDIGSAIINVLNLSINNFDGEYSNYDFEGAEVICYVGLQIEDEDTSELLDSAGEQILDSTGDTIIVHKNTVIEKTRICTATVVEQPEDETVTIDLTCEDNMRKFDRNYSDSKLKYPATRGQIVRDACEVCGVTLQTTSFDRDDYIVQNRPNDEALTFRQVLQWVAQIGCQWMRCDEYGRLCIGWYISINEEELIIDDLGVLKTQDDSNISLELSSANGILSANNGTFLENDGILRLFATDEKGNVSEIKTTYGFTPHHTDVVITGVKVTEYSESSSDNPQTYVVGTEGYVLGISGNKLIRVGDGQTIASMIAEKCVGMRFRPFESECPTDVAMEAGDSLIIVDRNGKIYTSLLTTTTLKPGSGQKIACNAKSAAKNSSTRYSQATQAFVTARNMVKQEKTEREKTLEEFGKRIDSATGVYTTEEIQEDGSRIFYLHDKPTLAESKAIWKMTSEAWGVSTDGGQTWNGGMTVDGDTIVRILTAVGLNADWINTGAITVKDKSGNIIFQVDMDTKKVIISGDHVQIGGKTATKAISDSLAESKAYSDGKLADYANTVTYSLSGLQAQIDGQIESFFYDYEPSLQNKPASEWTSTEERKKHEGDLFYWKSTGYAYRFMQDGATWKWQMIQDNDISKALAQAEKAQDTADGKRRTFVIQPSPPYDIGDLWSQDGGDILTCVVARAKGSVYASSDWKKLNKYTDDTTANKALEAAALAKNMTLQLSNDMQTITSDADGNIPIFPTVATTASVMYGSQDVTNDCSYTITKSDSVTGSWDVNTHTYTVTGLIADNGWVDIKATYLQTLSITRRFTIAKLKAGKNGVNGLDGLQGEKGEQGVPGKDGKDGTNGVDGKTSYFHIKYSSVANPTSSSQMTETPSTYIGTYVDYEPNDSTDPKKYTWSKFEGSDGKDGIAGTNGTDGKTYYLHIAYANSADGKTGFSVSDGTNKLYIGQYTDTTKTDSTDPTKYTWSKIKGETGADGKPGRTYIIEPSCNVLKRGSDKVISPNFITFKAYYRDGDSAARVPYKGRFIVEETVDGSAWKTIYISSTDEDTVTHYLYSILTNSSGQAVASSNGSTIGIPRDVTNVRCKLYASGGTTTLMDMQSVAVVIDVDNLTQEQIVSILTNDGAWKGLYYSNGRLYVSLDALLGGTVTLGGKKNGNGYLKIKDASNAVKGLIDRSGYTVLTNYEENSKYMEYTGVQFSNDGIFPVDIKKFFGNEADIEIGGDENWRISWDDNSLNIYATEVSADTGTFEDLTVANPASFAKSPRIEDMEYTTSSNTVCWDGRTGYKQLMLKSSSSKRYKDIGSDISEQEIEEWYNIEPLWAKYKEGYLVEGDENEGRYIPMFIAEDVEEYFPEATRHANGLVEDWNERIMIPAMFAMIKAQKKKIDQQEKLINKLCEKLNIE